MSWVSTASEDVFKIRLDGRVAVLGKQEIAKLIKEKLRKSRIVQKMFKEFDVSLDSLEDLNIDICDLEGKYGETDLKKMLINKNLFRGGNFFEEYFFVIVHEVYHFISRRQEIQSGFLGDPEEKAAFVMSVAYEMEIGTDMDTIWNRVYPKIKFHFHDEEDAREFFAHLVMKAKQFLQS